MLFSDSYFSVKQKAEGLFKDKGSKFFAFIYPVKTEEEIKMHLTELKKQHPSARHHCYAWRLGADKQAYKANDDGEPSNTAGKPILGQIQSHDLTNVLIVVVRYFGGTLLGVGGLINAYKNAALDAINNSLIEEKFILFEYKIEFGFDDVSGVMRILKENDCLILSRDYENLNSVVFQIKKQYDDKLKQQLSSHFKTKLTYIKTL
jgi:uncharacterized YigZ family protein